MQPTLAELVALLADAPTVLNRDAFYRALSATRVYFHAPSIPLGTEGPRTVQPGDDITITTAPGPSGAPMLLVFADPVSLLARFPNDSYAGIDGRALLQLAGANKAGVVVQCTHNGKSTWAGVPPEHVAHLLADSPSQGS